MVFCMGLTGKKIKEKNLKKSPVRTQMHTWIDKIE